MSYRRYGDASTGRWRFSFWHDYEPFFDPGHWNWVDWTLINISFERAHYCTRDELTIALLGFHFTMEHWRSARGIEGESE